MPQSKNAAPARTRAQIVADLAEANAAVDNYLQLSREAGSENLSIHYEGRAEGPSQWASELERELREFDAKAAPAQPAINDTVGTPITHLEAARMLLAQAECGIREPFAPLPALAAFDTLAAKAAALDALIQVCDGARGYLGALPYEHRPDPQWLAPFDAALKAAKLAQVSK